MGTADDKKNKITSIPGLSGIGLIITGFAGIFQSLNYASGVGLLASAIAFGIVFYVSFK